MKKEFLEDFWRKMKIRREGNERTMDCEKAGRWMIQNSDRMTS